MYFRLPLKQGEAYGSICLVCRKASRQHDSFEDSVSSQKPDETQQPCARMLSFEKTGEHAREVFMIRGRGEAKGHMRRIK